MTVTPVGWEDYYSREPNDDEIEFCRTVRYSEKIDLLEKRKESGKQ